MKEPVSQSGLPKLVVIVGPTASGKTTWSLRIAKKFNGEVVSADSRQIYKKMSIGTAKEPGEWRWQGIRKAYYIDDIPHHIIDFLDPGKQFNVAEFRDRAIKNIKYAHSKKKLAMMVGGTGLYVSSVIDNLQFPQVPPHSKLRESLLEKSTDELMLLLRQLDPPTADKIDQKNKRRIIRALEVCIFSGQPLSEQQGKGEKLFHILQIGIDIPRETLYERINKRVETMIEVGLLKEVEALVKQRYGWNLSSMNGIGYRQWKPYFEGAATLDEVVEILKRDTRKYARRQLTWFRRDPRIQWCTTYEQAEKLVEDFLDA